LIGALMIVSCPACSAQYRISSPLIRPNSPLRMRCSRCQVRFQLKDPSADASRLRVLVAHSDSMLCGAVGEVLEPAGIHYEICHDGHSALSAMEGCPPDVLLVDVALPGLYVFEILEIIRKRPDLSHVRSILLSSVYNRTAYKRRPTSLYGADDYIEKHHLPTDLISKIYSLTERQPVPAATNEEIGKSFAGFSEEQPNHDFVDRVNDQLLKAEQGEIDGSNALTPQGRAERLARIIVADISLYSQEKLDQGIVDGNCLQVMQPELDEARRIFDKLAAPEMAKRHEFLDNAFQDFMTRRCLELDISGK